MENLMSFAQLFNGDDHVESYYQWDETCIEYRGVVIKFGLDLHSGHITGASVNMKKALIFIKAYSIEEVSKHSKIAIDTYYNVLNSSSLLYKSPEELSNNPVIKETGFILSFTG